MKRIFDYIDAQLLTAFELAFHNLCIWQEKVVENNKNFNSKNMPFKFNETKYAFECSLADYNELEVALKKRNLV